MDKDETLNDFDNDGYNSIPENLKKEIGQFNVFHLKDVLSKDSTPISFTRRLYFKITLVFGKSRLHFADNSVGIEKQALVFFNPQTPYSWKPTGNQSGYFCVFTESFFQQFGNLKDYPVFQPGGSHLYRLTDAQAENFKSIFQEMFTEINSDYVFKYDVLRNLVYEVIHKAMKSQPLRLSSSQQVSNGSERVSSLFMELLERQFPIENTNQHIELRLASEYANRLNIHVNHLNRALKETVKQSTSDIIEERVVKEAKTLLRHTHWNISQIAYCLDFDEVSNFSNFFKKNTGLSPTRFRKESII